MTRNVPHRPASRPESKGRRVQAAVPSQGGRRCPSPGYDIEIRIPPEEQRRRQGQPAVQILDDEITVFEDNPEGTKRKVRYLYRPDSQYDQEVLVGVCGSRCYQQGTSDSVVAPRKRLGQSYLTDDQDFDEDLSPDNRPDVAEQARSAPDLSGPSQPCPPMKPGMYTLESTIFDAETTAQRRRRADRDGIPLRHRDITEQAFDGRSFYVRGSGAPGDTIILGGEPWRRREGPYYNIAESRRSQARSDAVGVAPNARPARSP